MIRRTIHEMYLVSQDTPSTTIKGQSIYPFEGIRYVNIPGPKFTTIRLKSRGRELVIGLDEGRVC